MNVAGRILLGAFAGWLTGVAVGTEGYGRVVRGRHVIILDIVYGIIGAVIGEYLFFWVVIGQGSTLSSYATAILGSITVVGAARLIVGKLRSYGSHNETSRPARSEF